MTCSELSPLVPEGSWVQVVIAAFGVRKDMPVVRLSSINIWTGYSHSPSQRLLSGQIWVSFVSIDKLFRAGSLWHKRAGASNSSDLSSTSRWTTLAQSAQALAGEHTEYYSDIFKTHPAYPNKFYKSILIFLLHNANNILIPSSTEAPTLYINRQIFNGFPASFIPRYRSLGPTMFQKSNKFIGSTVAPTNTLR